MTTDKNLLKIIIDMIKSIEDWDGETTQYLLEKIGMSEQMLRQLMLTSDVDAVKSLMDELSAPDVIIHRRVEFRMEMILDDVEKIRELVFSGDLGPVEFTNELEASIITCINNIAICCDLHDEECYDYKLYDSTLTIEERLTKLYISIRREEEYFDYDDRLGTCHIQTNDSPISYDLTPFWEDVKGIPINVYDDDVYVTNYVIDWKYPETDEEFKDFEKFYRWFVKHTIFRN